jgi:hypothetical protein
MRLIEGTVDEVVEYQQRISATGNDVVTDVGTPAADVIPEGHDPAEARTASGDSWTDDDEFFIKQFIYGRATDGPTAERVLRYLHLVADMGTAIATGKSERTKDGLTDYLMVRDEEPRRFGAVAYVMPSGRLTLRLRPEDVSDLTDERIKPRDVKASQKYAINCPLVDDKALDLAVTLTERALNMVRRTS